MSKSICLFGLFLLFVLNKTYAEYLTFEECHLEVLEFMQKKIKL